MSKILLLNVGINKYPDFLNNLEYSVNDASLIHSSYERYNCALKKKLLDQEATKTNILTSLEDIKNQARDDDYIILSFAGHGGSVEFDKDKITSKNTFLFPYDVQKDYLQTTAISLHELKEIIAEFKTNSVLVILDACHSGGVLRRKMEDLNLREVSPKRMMELMLPNMGISYMTACDANEFACEDNKLKQGIFTHYLIQTLTRKDTKIKSLPLMDVHEKVLEKVREATNNKQNPQCRSDDNSFSIPIILMSDEKIKRKISLEPNLYLIPDKAQKNPIEFIQDEDLKKLEKNVMLMIQNKATVLLDELLKSLIRKLFAKSSALTAPPHRDSEVLEIYDTCREHLKPVVEVMRLLLTYGHSEIITNNLDSIFTFERIVHNRSGLTATLEIPIAVQSEIILKIMGLAYAKKNVGLLQKLFTPVGRYRYGIDIPFIYSRRTYHPEVFHQNAIKYFEYIFPKEKLVSDPFARLSMQNFFEMNFLFDIFRSTGRGYSCFPYYTFSDENIPEIVATKLKEKEYQKFVEQLFSTPIQRIIPLAIDRLREVMQYSDLPWDIRTSFPATINTLEAMKSEI